MIDWLYAWLILWLIDCMLGWFLNDYRINCFLLECLLNWFNEFWFNFWLIDWLIAWLINELLPWLIFWSRSLPLRRVGAWSMAPAMESARRMVTASNLSQGRIILYEELTGMWSNGTGVYTWKSTPNPPHHLKNNVFRSIL